MTTTQAGFCGRCGLPFAAGGGPFCARCGNALAATQATTATGVYPVVPSATVPAAQHKLSRSTLFAAAAVVMVLVVGVITLVAVQAQPTTVPCGFFCGPRTGPLLANPQQFRNSKWGFTIDYPSDVMKISGQDADSVTFSLGQLGVMTFTATAGTGTQQAIQDAVSKYPTSEFQDRKLIGPVPGAEVGLIAGDGQGYKATAVPPNGGSQQPVGIMVLAATNGKFTIAVSMLSLFKDGVQFQPFGLLAGGLFDVAITNLRFPSS